MCLNAGQRCAFCLKIGWKANKRLLNLPLRHRGCALCTKAQQVCDVIGTTSAGPFLGFKGFIKRYQCVILFFVTISQGKGTTRGWVPLQAGASPYCPLQALLAGHTASRGAGQDRTIEGQPPDQQHIRVGWFLKKNIVPNCFRVPNPKLTWHRASENFICYPKMSQLFCFI